MILALFCLLLLPVNSPAAASVLSAHVPAVTKSLAPTGTLPDTTQLRLAISLPLRNQAALSAFLRDIYDPSSPDFRHFLSPGQFTEKFGPAAADYTVLQSFADSNHLHITQTYPNRLLLDVTGSAADIQRAFHVTLLTFNHPTESRAFYAPDREPAADCSVPILHISGLDNYSLPRPHLNNIRRLDAPNPANFSANPSSGSGFDGTYLGNDFRAAYAPGSSLDGTGQTVALVEFDGYNNIDILYYAYFANLPNVPLNNVLIDGASGAPSTNDGQNIEVCLDIEVALSMAPAMTNLLVYIAPNGAPFEDILNRMAADNLAQQLSCSWYILDGASQPAADAIWQEMAAQGQSFFNASGDSDAYTGLINFPCDSPYITQVGGATLSTTGPGGAWSAETVWNWDIELGSNYDGVGSSGGVSTQYSIPDYQTNISMVANEGSTAMRNVPDVAMTADNIFVVANGYGYSVGGTSCAAPLWAAFTALANQEAAAGGQTNIGFVNPALDAIGTGTNYTNAFHDITTGNDTWSQSTNAFFAVPGYDLCTGWGTPAGQTLLDILANAVPFITPGTGFASTGPPGGPFTIVSENFSLTDPQTNSLNWAIGGVPDWLSLSLTNGSLDTNSPTATVTVGLNANSSNLVGGSYSATLWFTNLNNNFVQNRSFSLTVLSPPAITTQPSNQSVIEGTTAQFTVAATGTAPLSYQWQFNGTNLTDGENISGSATTNLTITAASDADVGDYSVIVTNIAGEVSSSNASLTLTPSAPIITSQPTNQTVSSGSNAAFSVTVIGTSPYFYQWSLNTTNIPGATNSILSLTNIQLDQAGAYVCTVTNSVGSTNSSNAILTVIPPPACVPAPTNIVGWWPAEDNPDDVVSTNDGVLAGAACYTNGLVGQAFDFLQTGDQVAIPATALPTGTSDRTIECWVYINSFVPSAETDFAGYGAYGTNGEIYHIGTTTAHEFYFTQWGQAIIGPTLTTNQWYHVAVTSHGTNLITLYLDGANVAEGSLSFNTPSNTTLYVGGVNAPFITRQLIGLVDELSIYSRALSSAEIAAIYNAGSGGKCPLPPVILAQPASQSVAPGSTVAFSVVASGATPLQFQWSFDGTNIASATNSSLTLTNVQPAQAGIYSVAITNGVGSIISSNASLTINVPPTITTQPASQTNVVSGTSVFTVTATGSAPLAFQWSFNGINLLSATNSSLTISNLQFTQAGNYAVLVTNAFGSVLSSNAVLVVNPLLTFLWEPVASPQIVGVPFSVTIEAENPTNSQLATNFTGTVDLLTTNGIPVTPSVSANFVAGQWNGSVTIFQPSTNLVLESIDSYDEIAYANPIAVLCPPSLTTTLSNNTLDITWPTNPPGFILQTSPSLSPANWTTVTPPPTQLSNLYLETITITGTNAFYQLLYTGP